MKREPVMVASYFAVFLRGFAPLRDNCRTKRVISRKDAKSQRLAKPNQNMSHDAFSDLPAVLR